MDGQATLWEQMLPDEIQLMGPELEAIDSLLDDPRFPAPFVERFFCPIGRPTIPMECYLRLMYLKHRYGLGYETLCKEVADSLSWRRFCRIALHTAPPHPTTLMKLTRRFGPGIVEDLNRVLLERAVEGKLLSGRRLRFTLPCSAAHPPADPAPERTTTCTTSTPMPSSRPSPRLTRTPAHSAPNPLAYCFWGGLACYAMT